MINSRRISEPMTSQEDGELAAFLDDFELQFPITNEAVDLEPTTKKEEERTFAQV